jgi:DNA helicase HerA-like ATPase
MPKAAFGYNDYFLSQKNQQVPVIFDSKRAINPHMLFMGKSGTGKTFNLKRIIRSLLKTSDKQIRVHIFDIHGDISVEGESVVKFSESTQYGFNPLEINPDPDFGGVRKQIQSFLRAIADNDRAVGSKQEAALRALLTSLYAANGFTDKPESWRLDDGIQRRFPKKNPTLADAYRFAQAKLKALYLGSDSATVQAYEVHAKRASAFQAKAKSAARTGGGMSNEEREKLEEELEATGEKAIESFRSFVKSIKSGRELEDSIQYDSKEVMKSVVDKLENLNAKGIFRPDPPPFDPDAQIWRYDIRALSDSETELKMFVYFRLKSIFNRAKQRGLQDDVIDVVVIDEAHNYFNNESDNILNIIAKEARKFGLMMICASQSPTHFSDDFLTNVGTKVLLGIDKGFWDGAVRKLKIDEKTLKFIVPKRTLAVQIENDGELAPRFVGVQLPAAA